MVTRNLENEKLFEPVINTTDETIGIIESNRSYYTYL